MSMESDARTERDEKGHLQWTGTLPDSWPQPMACSARYEYRPSFFVSIGNRAAGAKY